MASLIDLLKTTVEMGGSDLHMTVDTPPQVRVHGHLQRLLLPDLVPSETKQLIYSVLTDLQKKRFEETLELDFSFGIKGLSRFRCNVFTQRGAVAALQKGDSFIAEMVDRCRAGRELVFQRLSAQPRVTIARPEAAFYNFFSVDGVSDTMSFCKTLARDYKVGLAPGEAFAAGGKGNIRLCFASGAEPLSRGLDRIEAAIKAL